MYSTYRFYTWRLLLVFFSILSFLDSLVKKIPIWISMVSSELPCSKISESQSKIYKNEIVWRFNGNRSYAEYQGLAWVAISLWFYCLWSPALKKDLLSKVSKVPTLRAQIKMLAISLPRAVTAFETGSASHFSTQVTTNHRITGKWPLMQDPATRHMTDPR